MHLGHKSIYNEEFGGMYGWNEAAEGMAKGLYLTAFP